MDKNRILRATIARSLENKLVGQSFVDRDESQMNDVYIKHLAGLYFEVTKTNRV